MPKNVKELQKEIENVSIQLSAQMEIKQLQVILADLVYEMRLQNDLTVVELVSEGRIKDRVQKNVKRDREDQRRKAAKYLEDAQKKVNDYLAAYTEELVKDSKSS